LFLTGESGFRRANPILKLLYLATALYIFITRMDYLSSIYITILSCILGGLDKGVRWVYSALVLSAIPAAWFGLTTYVMIVAGMVHGHYDPILVFIRTIALSIIILFYASITSPTRVYNIMVRLGLERYAVTPLLTWRIIPYGLKNMVESLAITSLKRERIGRRIAPAIASIIELGDNIRLSSYPKIYNPPHKTIPYKGSHIHDLALIVSIILLIAPVLFM
jgi:hypothetical protein